MKDFQQQNYYELLDVAVTANQDEILSAYKKARAAYSGNSPALYSVFTKKEAEDILKLVDEAYAVLSNQFKRKEYNKQHFSHLMPQTTVETAPSQEQQPTPPVAKSTSSPDLVPLSGHKNVSVKKPAEQTPPGITKFGRYAVDEAFESNIRGTEEFTGSFLQQIRIYKNISLDQIASQTKIGRPYLHAIEQSDYTSLPAQVFLRGFLVQFAKVLDLDAQKVASSYLKIMQESLKK